MHRIKNHQLMTNSSAVQVRNGSSFDGWSTQTDPLPSGPGASLSEVPTISDTASEYLAAAALSDDRAAAYRRLLSEIERVLGPMPVTDITGLAALLDAKHAAGFSPGTIRKHVWMVRAFYKWAWENRYTSAETYLAVRTIKPPQESSRSAQPQRYTRAELGKLREILDERWRQRSGPLDRACPPRLPPGWDAARAALSSDRRGRQLLSLP
jgi:hypothetical protein